MSICFINHVIQDTLQLKLSLTINKMQVKLKTFIVKSFLTYELQQQHKENSEEEADTKDILSKVDLTDIANHFSFLKHIKGIH